MPSHYAHRVAILDRDPAFAQVLTRRLDRCGWHRVTLSSPVRHESLRSMRLNAVVVDTATLGADLWRWLEGLCESLPQCGVLLCSERSSAQQRARGLRLGADDWVSKPCHPEEVIARLEAIIRRRSDRLAETLPESIWAADLEIRYDRRVIVAGTDIGLTRLESELLMLLASQTGEVVEREEIYQRIWGYRLVPGDRSVDVHVRKLRAKLRAASPRFEYIHTHRKVGYSFSPTLRQAGPRLPGEARASRPRGQAPAAPCRGAGRA